MPLIIVDGRPYTAKYIGKGSFSKVYRVGDRVVYYTRGDCSKEVLAMYLYDPHTHLPSMVRHDDIVTKGNRWYVFSSPYYRNVTKKDKSAYELMRKVMYYTIQLVDKAYSNGLRGIDIMEAVVAALKYYKEIPRSIIKAMDQLVELAKNCGENMHFDLHRKNFGVNEYGTLIFRDPMYQFT
jgi:hypothetical protein